MEGKDDKGSTPPGEYVSVSMPGNHQLPPESYTSFDGYRCAVYPDSRQLLVLHSPMGEVVDHGAGTKWIT